MSWFYSPMSRPALLALIVVAIFLAAFVCDVPHTLWHDFEDTRIEREWKLVKRTVQVVNKIVRYVDTTGGPSPTNLTSCVNLGVLESAEFAYLTNHSTIFSPFTKDTPTNAVIVELAGTGIVIFRNGNGTRRYRPRSN